MCIFYNQVCSTYGLIIVGNLASCIRYHGKQLRGGQNAAIINNNNRTRAWILRRKISRSNHKPNDRYGHWLWWSWCSPVRGECMRGRAMRVCTHTRLDALRCAMHFCNGRIYPHRAASRDIAKRDSAKLRYKSTRYRARCL